MKLLLDTHILIRAMADDDLLSLQARKLIGEPSNEIFYSIVSPWEIEIKHQKHPKEMPFDGRQIAQYAEMSGFHQVPVTIDAIHALKTLERMQNTIDHKDPFDRIMICQAQVNGMFLLTEDARISEYMNPCIITC